LFPVYVIKYIQDTIVSVVVNQEKARSGTAGKSRGRARQKMACSTGANRVFKVIGEEGAEL